MMQSAANENYPKTTERTIKETTINGAVNCNDDYCWFICCEVIDDYWFIRCEVIITTMRTTPLIDFTIIGPNVAYTTA